MEHNTFQERFDCLIKVDNGAPLMPVLVRYSVNAKHVTELGVGKRSIFGSSCLLNNPQKFVQVDTNDPDIVCSNDLKELCEANGVEYRFISGDAKLVDLEPTNLLIVDDDHSIGQVAANLKKHAHLVKQYIVFHDTNIEHITREIDEFLKIHAEWKIDFVTRQACGLKIIKRIS